MIFKAYFNPQASKAKCLFVLLLLLLLSACRSQHEKDAGSQLSSAELALESDPTQALSLLQKVETALLSEHDYNYYVLLQARAYEKSGVNIALFEEAVLKAKDYFLDMGNAPKVAYASFVAASVYEAQERATKALHYYLQADEWAAKANNQIPHFWYSAIPYNIALLYEEEGKYEKSLQYLQKALSYIDTENNGFESKLYALELKGLNFKNLGMLDSALYYSDAALDIANKHNDIVSTNRILYNKTMLLCYSKDYQRAEDACNKLLPTFVSANDSLHVGRLHMALARIYANTYRLSQAKESIYRAQSMLSGAKGITLLILYETLAQVEDKLGNFQKSQAFQQQYKSYEQEMEDSRNAEVQSIQASLKKQQSEKAGEVLQLITHNREIVQKQLNVKRNIILISAICMLSLGLILYIRHVKQRKDMRRLCREEIMLYISRRKGLEQVAEQLKSIEECEQKHLVMDRVDDVAIALKMSPQLDYCYGKLYFRLQDAFPMLNTKELELYWLSHTQMLNEEEIMEFLNLSSDQFAETKRSMQEKLQNRKQSA